MNKITIVPDDNMVGIDGRFISPLDMSSISGTIHAIQVELDPSTGDIKSSRIEYKADENGLLSEGSLNSLNEIQEVVDLWKNAANLIDNPPPKEPKEFAADYLAVMRRTCMKYIDEGTVSVALGTNHTYPATAQDQANLTRLVTLSTTVTDSKWTADFWCMDTNDVWDLRPHTASQIQQVGHDISQFISGAQAKFKKISDEISAVINDKSKTDDQKRSAISAITW